MSKKNEPSWQSTVLLLGLSFANFEGLASFILFLLVLLALVLWMVYRFAAIIVPAFVLALCALVALFLPFHAWTKATAGIRARKRIDSCLAEMRALERLQASRKQILPLEQRAREAAQVLVDQNAVRARGLQRQRSATKHRQELRTLNRESEDLRITYGVVPEQDWFCRLIQLHLLWDSVRYLAESPGQARFLLLAVVATLTTAVAAVL